MTISKNQTPIDAWHGLNARQQIYMQAIYATDQAQEQAERLRAAMDRWSRSADQWRWMLYADIMDGHTPLKQRLVEADVVDPGTGSTFEALEKRGYILVKYEQVTSHPRSDTLVSVRLTTAGRKLVRQAFGLSAPKKPPVGELREWHWRALAEAWKARPAGLKSDISGTWAKIGWNTWLRLRNYRVHGKDCPLVEEYSERKPSEWWQFWYWYGIKLTPDGEHYYRDHWQHYHNLYPDVDAPEPNEHEGPTGGK